MKREPITHELKLSTAYFYDVCTGQKNFELRKFDRDYRVNDKVVFKEVLIDKYTGRTSKEFYISYILAEVPQFGLSEEYCILGLSEEPIKDMEEVYEEVTNDNVNHPKHYGREGAMECIDEMVLVFGKDAVMEFCLCNAWKYRYRAADKNGAEDLAKSDWYMKKYKQLKEHEKTILYGMDGEVFEM